MKIYKEDRPSYNHYLESEKEAKRLFGLLQKNLGISTFTYEELYNAILSQTHSDMVDKVFSDYFNPLTIKYINTAKAFVMGNGRPNNYAQKCININNNLTLLLSHLCIIQQWKTSTKFLYEYSKNLDCSTFLEKDVINFLLKTPILIDVVINGEIYTIDFTYDAQVNFLGSWTPCCAFGLYKGYHPTRELLKASICTFTKSGEVVILEDCIRGGWACSTCGKECAKKCNICYNGSGRMVEGYEYCSAMTRPSYCAAVTAVLEGTNINTKAIFDIIHTCASQYIYYTEMKKAAEKSKYNVSVARKIDDKKKVYVSCESKENKEVFISLDREFNKTVKRDCIAYGTGTKHSHHASPCAHYRRATTRRLKSGKIVTVRATVVNPTNVSSRVVTHIAK